MTTEIHPNLLLLDNEFWIRVEMREAAKAVAHVRNFHPESRRYAGAEARAIDAHEADYGVEFTVAERGEIFRMADEIWESWGH